jgi:glycosyltransferase involved in cell wall biosynthesis
MTEPWLIVAGDLTPLGGMDTANHALARYLGGRDVDLHLVTHRAWPDLQELPNITVHPAWRPFNKHLLGSPLLSREGHRVWRLLSARRGHAPRAVVNGGNCRLAGANWVHYLHAAYEAPTAGSAGRRAKASFAHQRDLKAERTALHNASVVLCNSERTKRDVVERVGIEDARVKVVYYGSDPIRFAFVDASQRAAAKRALGRSVDRPLVGFVGALGDRRKAFDSIFHAWVALCAQRDWDADLVVVGSGAELPAWRDRAEAAGLTARMTFLGFRSDVPDILAALDALIHPARYEAYGLSVHEALCRGLPALVSASAGVAEQYPAALGDLLITDADDAGELAERLTGWRRGMERFRELVAPVSARLRARTWDAMACEIVECVERAA